jgi:hypothetical protein
MKKMENLMGCRGTGSPAGFFGGGGAQGFQKPSPQFIKCPGILKYSISL